MEEGKRVLVVDDDPVIGLSCERVLWAKGFEVQTVTNGRDALKKLGADKVDLLISDIRLPDIYGINVLAEARKIQPGTDVVMITGYPTLEDAKESIRLGAFEFVEKPFTPEFLGNIAAKVFNKRGWILRKSFIDQFNKFITPGAGLDDTAVYYKDGTWARPCGGGVWEIGFDVRHWHLGGHMLYIDMVPMDTLKSGEVFARILLSEGKIVELKSPMSGNVAEANPGVNDALCSLVAEGCMSESWQVWLLRVRPAAV